MSCVSLHGPVSTYLHIYYLVSSIQYLLSSIQYLVQSEQCGIVKYLSLCLAACPAPSCQLGEASTEIKHWQLSLKFPPLNIHDGQILQISGYCKRHPSIRLRHHFCMLSAVAVDELNCFYNSFISHQKQNPFICLWLLQQIYIYINNIIMQITFCCTIRATSFCLSSQPLSTNFATIY